MPTVKQRKIAKLIIENEFLGKSLNGGEIVEKSGYGKSMKLYPKRIIETKGVEDSLKEYGFSEDNAKKVVSEIMLNDKEKSEVRLKATDQVFKVHGSYIDTIQNNKTLNILIVPETSQRYAIPPSTETNSN